jgi:hypothetical protein
MNLNSLPGVTRLPNGRSNVTSDTVRVAPTVEPTITAPGLSVAQEVSPA